MGKKKRISKFETELRDLLDITFGLVSEARIMQATEELPEQIQKVFRLGGVQKKLAILQDSTAHEKFKNLAGTYGLSFDRLILGIYDRVVETLLCTSSGAFERLMEFKRDKLWERVCLNRYQFANGTRHFHLYRFHNERPTKSYGKTFYRYPSSKIEIHLHIPETVYKALFNKEIEREIFDHFPRHRLLRDLLDEFLMANGIPYPTSPYLTEEYFFELDKALFIIGCTTLWKPHNWISPPISGPPCELFKKVNTSKPSGKVTLFFNSNKLKVTKDGGWEPIFDFARDILPYVQQRLWRTSNQTFSLLLLKFLVEIGAYNPSTDDISKNFIPILKERLSRRN